MLFGHHIGWFFNIKNVYSYRDKVTVENKEWRGFGNNKIRDEIEGSTEEEPLLYRMIRTRE